MIRLANSGDLSRLAEIHVCGWRYAYRGIISDSELFSKRLVSSSMGNFEKQLAKGSRVLVFEDEKDGILKGFASHGRCRDEDKQDSHEIYAIYLQPEFTRCGIGSQLCAEVEILARAEGRFELRLWVLEKNLRGFGFYSKQGFRADGAEKLIENWQAKEIRMAKAL